jgi:NAD-dependent dihydropyrimidine dehydrogenase PreA subunit
MAIEKIDPDLCNGCGICENSCPADVIRMDEQTKKAIIVYPEDCTLCTICEQDCPQKAIYVSPAYSSPIPTSFGP